MSETSHYGGSGHIGEGEVHCQGECSREELIGCLFKEELKGPEAFLVEKGGVKALFRWVQFVLSQFIIQCKLFKEITSCFSMFST